jgi:hypothetical protein
MAGACSSLASKLGTRHVSWGDGPGDPPQWKGGQTDEQMQGHVGADADGTPNCTLWIPYPPGANGNGGSFGGENVQARPNYGSSVGLGCDDTLATMGADAQGNAVCNCKSGHSNAGICTSTQKSDQQCKSDFGRQSGDGSTKFAWSGGTTACWGGCVSTPSSMYGSGGNQWAVGPWTTVGGSCDGNGAGGNGQQPSDGKPTPAGVNEDPNASQCKAPTACWGTVNGTGVCVACSSSGSEQTTVKESTSPDGTTTTPGDVTTKQTTDNGDGSTTTTTRTTHPDGSVDTRQTTGPKSAGSSSTAASGASPGGGFCDQNPTVSICQKTSFGGSCSATFTCDGDAVQCAIAKEQHMRNCSFYDPASQGGDAANDVSRLQTARGDGDVPSWSPAAAANQSSTQLDFASGISQDHPWSTGCVSDQSLTLAGLGTVVMPWSTFCSSWQLIGKLVIAVTFLACLGIVFKQ